MRLLFLGKELDTEKEHELLADNLHGFNVMVAYKPDSWMPQHEGKQVVVVMRNVTEVHHLYETHINQKRIAFESNIHFTGCNRSCDDIESVTVDVAPIKFPAFFE